MAESPNPADTPRNNGEIQEDDQRVNDTDGMPMSGRKGGATPVALYSDYSETVPFDRSRMASESPSGISRWLPFIIAIAIVAVILFLASQYLSFPSSAGSPAGGGSVSTPAR